MCPCCQGQLHKIGEDVNEVLDVIPVILQVLRIIRLKRGSGVVQALPRLIESGTVSIALVAYVIAFEVRLVSDTLWPGPDPRRSGRESRPLDPGLVREARRVRVKSL